MGTGSLHRVAVGCRGGMEMLEDSRGGLLGRRGWLNAEDLEPLVVGEGRVEAVWREVLLGNGPPDAEEEVPTCLGLDDKRPPLGSVGRLTWRRSSGTLC